MRLLLAAALALALPAATAAQTVRGVLVERGTGRPIASAVVILLDDLDERRDAALTAADGRFELRAPFAGTFTLRAERVGYRATVSPPLALAEEQTVDFRMEGDATPITLAAVRARAGRRCEPQPGSGPETAEVWEEARKALDAAVLASRRRLLRYDVELFSRQLAPGTLEVLQEQRRPLAGMTRSPFVAGPADELSRQGFVRVVDDQVVYDAPDAVVLLSDAFLADHCFRVEEDPARPALVGLAFEPVPSRTLPEVAGVLWLERATSRLRRMDFRYVHIPRQMEEAGTGGGVEFEQLGDGRWIVSRWWIRTPQFRPAARTSEGVAVTVDGPVLASLLEQGGEVKAGTRRDARAVGTIRGAVWDSVAGRPLADAEVFVSGTQIEARSDAEGRFVLDSVPEGRHVVSFQHPVLAEWSALPASAEVGLPPGEEADVALAVPSRETLLARLCPRQERGPNGVVMGTVLRGGEPQPGVTVRFTWLDIDRTARSAQERFFEVETGEAGRFLACGVPEDQEMRVRVKIGNAWHTAHPLMAAEGFRRHDVVIDR